MRKLAWVATLCMAFLVGKVADAQQFDLALGFGSVIGPSASSASGNYSPQTIGGGVFPSFSGDFLLKHNFGVQGEVAWRAGQNLYGGFQPFRPIFYDVNGIYAPHISKIGAEIMAGIGAETVRFYQPFFNCSFTGCTNYTSTTHFMGHVGGGVHLYVFGNFFVRPEAHLYLVHNNFEFSSGRATRVGVSIGYTFRPGFGP